MAAVAPTVTSTVTVEVPSRRCTSQWQCTSHTSHHWETKPSSRQLLLYSYFSSNPRAEVETEMTFRRTEQERYLPSNLDLKADHAHTQKHSVPTFVGTVNLNVQHTQ